MALCQRSQLVGDLDSELCYHQTLVRWVCNVVMAHEAAESRCCSWNAQALLVTVIAMVAQDPYRRVRVQDGLSKGSEDLGADPLAAIQWDLLHQQRSQNSHALHLPSQVILPCCRHWHSLCRTLMPVYVSYSSDFCQLFYGMMQQGALKRRGYPAPSYHCPACLYSITKVVELLPSSLAYSSCQLRQAAGCI